VKLEYLSGGFPECPLIRLYEFNRSGDCSVTMRFVPRGRSLCCKGVLTVAGPRRNMDREAGAQQLQRSLPATAVGNDCNLKILC
jgi:hypothetical protein